MLGLELRDFFICNLHLCFIVHLVCEHHYFHIRARVLIDLTEPDWNAKEAFSVGEVENDNDSVGTLVVGIGDGAVPFLASCVPDLQLDRGLIDL